RRNACFFSSAVVKGSIDKHNERAQLERFDARSKELKERIDRERPGSTNGPVPVPEDLGTLLKQISSTYSNYLKDADEILLAIKKGYSGPELPKHVDKAGTQAAQLLDLAARARAGAGAIKTFLDLLWQASARQSGLR